MSRRSVFIFLLILAAYVGLAAVRLDHPFLYHRENNSAAHAKWARNFLWHGFGVSRGIPLDTSGHLLENYPRYQDQFYPDHPPLPMWSLAGLFALLGPGEWVVRLHGHLFAMGCLALFCLLMRRWFEVRTALLATAILALTPMFAYFTAVNVHQAPPLFFILAGLLAYTRWLRSCRKRDLLMLLGCQFLACYSDWPGYYLAVVLFLHLAFIQKRWKFAFVFPVVNLFIFGLYLLHLYAADPEGLAALRQLWHIYKGRSESVPLGGYLSGEARELALYFTVAAILAAAGWTISRLWRPRSPGDLFVICLPVLALDEIWLRSVCHIHDYYSYHLSLFVAIAAARMGMELVDLSRNRRWLIPIPLLLAFAFLAQSGWVLHRRLTTKGAYEFYYRQGVAIRETTHKDDRILVLTDHLAYYTPFYAERFADYFHSKEGIVFSDYMGPRYMGRRTQTNLGAVLESLEKGNHSYDWVVVAERDMVTSEVKYFQKVRRGISQEEYDKIMRKFGVEIPDSQTLKRLEHIALERVERGGFVFHRLRKSR